MAEYGSPSSVRYGATFATRFRGSLSYRIRDCELIPSEKRRLEVARALATEPKLLLLDEVLTGLTPIEAQTGVELVRKVRATGVTVLMVEHVMEIVMPLVDRAIVLDLGKVLVEGKPADIVRNPKVISAYLGDRHAVGA